MFTRKGAKRAARAPKKAASRPTLAPIEAARATRTGFGFAPIIEGAYFLARLEIMGILTNAGRPRLYEKSINKIAVCTTVVPAFVTLLMLVIATYFIIFKKNTSDWFTCQTPQCQQVRDLTVALLAENGTPCEDFYSYVCNTWERHGAHKPSFLEDAKGAFWESVNHTLMTSPPPFESLQVLFKFYGICYKHMSILSHKEADISEAVSSISRKLGITHWINNQDIASIFVKLISLALTKGIATIFAIHFLKVADEELMHLTKGESLRARARPISYERFYLNYIRDIVRVLLSRENVDREFQDLLDIDSTVDMAFSKPAETHPVNFSVVGLFGSLDRRLNAALWLDTINRNVIPRLVQEVGSEVLVTGHMEMLLVRDKLGEKQMLYMVCTYLHVQVLMEILRFDYFRRFEVQHPRDVMVLCLNVTRRLLSFTWPYLIANLTSSAGSPTDSQGIFSRIVQASAQTMPNMTWMELPSRLEATRKVKSLSLMTVKGVPPTVVSRVIRYTRQEVLKGDFVDSYLKMATFDAGMRQELLGQTIHGVLGSYEAAGDVLYLEESNSVFLPIVAATPPVYYPVGVDDPFNFGTLGVMLSRAVSTALGPTGSRVKADGSNVDWWTLDTRLSFARTVDCYVKQYMSMERSSEVPSAEQREEIFLLVRSVRIAYDSHREDEDTLRTGSAKLTPRRRAFFVRACLLSCRSPGDAGQRRFKSYCNLPVMNMPEFAEAFRCRETDRLNPRERCPFM